MLAFNEAPVSVEVPVGSEAVFRCQHSTANNIDWIVNGSFVGRSPPPDITLGIITEGDNPVDTLTIVARHDYNGTTIVCVAVFRDGSPDETSQPAAVLRVQGEISNCTRIMVYFRGPGGAFAPPPLDSVCPPPP